MTVIKAVPYAKLPKRNYCRAADCYAVFDRIAEALDAKPKLGSYKDGSAWAIRYRSIYVELSSGRCAILTEAENAKSRVDINLELIDYEIFHEEDLLEIADTLKLEMDYVKRIQNNFTWILADGHVRAP